MCPYDALSSTGRVEQGRGKAYLIKIDEGKRTAARITAFTSRKWKTPAVAKWWIYYGMPGVRRRPPLPLLSFPRRSRLESDERQTANVEGHGDHGNEA